MKIVVLGASGLIGSAMLRVLSENNEWQVYGTLRNSNIIKYYSDDIKPKIITNIDVEHESKLLDLLDKLRPDVVVNCIGITKHVESVNNPLFSIPLNTIYPHKLEKMCGMLRSRLVHISTDCVFSGKKGNYTERDTPDAEDLYGKSKYLGEINNTRSITLRTSTIGHEFETNYGLLNWFLLQNKQCSGYAKAIFSGLPTVVLAQVVKRHVIPNNELTGLYHVGGEAISKYDLLQIISDIYGKKINIIKDEKIIIDRSLDSTKFSSETGYKAPGWPDLIQEMYSYYLR